MRKIVFIVFFCLCGSLFAQSVRPAFDNIGFVWKAEQVDLMMNYLKKTHDKKKSDPSVIPVAGICPHDDYLFAGDVSFPLMNEIKAKEVIIFGVTHGTARKLLNNPERLIILDDFENWSGPYGPVAVSPLRETIKNELDKKYFIVNNDAHKNEHSIEAMIPYLQYFNRDIKVTPVMITVMKYEDMIEITSSLSEIILNYMKTNNLQAGKDIFFLFSCDASHYGPDFNNTVYGTGESGHEKAVKADIDIAEHFLEGEINPEKIKGFMVDKNLCNAVWCGRYSVPFGLLTTYNVMKKNENKSLKGHILKYSDTYSHGVLPLKGNGFGITAPFSTEHWVGHLSVMYY